MAKLESTPLIKTNRKTVWFYLISILPFEWVYKLIKKKPLLRIVYFNNTGFTITGEQARN